MLNGSRSSRNAGYQLGTNLVPEPARSLLTVDEVAERLGVTKDWVWAQARAGRIPHVQLGRYRRFREEALDRW